MKAESGVLLPILKANRWLALLPTCVRLAPFMPLRLAAVINDGAPTRGRKMRPLTLR